MSEPGPGPEQQPSGPPAGQPPYGQPYGQPGYGYPVYVPPTNPKATTALVLGLISTVGALMCLLPALVGPFAWFTAVRARKEIRESPGRFGGDGQATAGLVLGIIGTCLLALFLIAFISLVVWAATEPSSFNDTFDNGTTV